MPLLCLGKHPELSPVGQAPSQPEARADEGPFPVWYARLLRCKGMKAKILYLKNLSTSLSMVLSKNDVRLIGQKSLGPP